jgi:hypothetical protein
MYAIASVSSTMTLLEMLLIRNLDLVPVDRIPCASCVCSIVRPCSSHVLSPLAYESRNTWESQGLQTIWCHLRLHIRIWDYTTHWLHMITLCWRYYHLVRLMGRSASHIALEVARAPVHAVHVHLSARPTAIVVSWRNVSLVTAW